MIKDTAVGPVRIINVIETVINMVVPFIAALLNAWLVDSIPLHFESHFAINNLQIIALLVITIGVKGPNE